MIVQVVLPTGLVEEPVARDIRGWTPVLRDLLGDGLPDWLRDFLGLGSGEMLQGSQVDVLQLTLLDGLEGGGGKDVKTVALDLLEDTLIQCIDDILVPELLASIQVQGRHCSLRDEQGHLRWILCEFLEEDVRQLLGLEELVDKVGRGVLPVGSVDQLDDKLFTDRDVLDTAVNDGLELRLPKFIHKGELGQARLVEVLVGQLVCTHLVDLVTVLSLLVDLLVFVCEAAVDIIQRGYRSLGCRWGIASLIHRWLRWWLVVVALARVVRAQKMASLAIIVMDVWMFRV